MADATTTATSSTSGGGLVGTLKDFFKCDAASEAQAMGSLSSRGELKLFEQDWRKRMSEGEFSAEEMKIAIGRLVATRESAAINNQAPTDSPHDKVGVSDLPNINAQLRDLRGALAGTHLDAKAPKWLGQDVAFKVGGHSAPANTGAFLRAAGVHSYA